MKTYPNFFLYFFPLQLFHNEIIRQLYPFSIKSFNLKIELDQTTILTGYVDIIIN